MTTKLSTSSKLSQTSNRSLQRARSFTASSLLMPHIAFEVGLSNEARAASSYDTSLRAH